MPEEMALEGWRKETICASNLPVPEGQRYTYGILPLSAKNDKRSVMTAVLGKEGQRLGSWPLLVQAKDWATPIALCGAYET